MTPPSLLWLKLDAKGQNPDKKHARTTKRSTSHMVEPKTCLGFEVEKQNNKLDVAPPLETTPLKIKQAHMNPLAWTPINFGSLLVIHTLLSLYNIEILAVSFLQTSKVKGRAVGPAKKRKHKLIRQSVFCACYILVPFFNTSWEIHFFDKCRYINFKFVPFQLYFPNSFEGGIGQQAPWTQSIRHVHDDSREFSEETTGWWPQYLEANQEPHGMMMWNCDKPWLWCTCSHVHCLSSMCVSGPGDAQRWPRKLWPWIMNCWMLWRPAGVRWSSRRISAFDD